MSSKLTQRCTTTLSCVAIIILVAVIVTVWVMLGQGAFRPSPRRLHRTNSTTTITSLYLDNFPQNTSTERNMPTMSTKHKKLLDKSHLDNLGDENVEFVKPLKISPLPLHEHDIIFDQLHNKNDNHDKPQLRHHSGHFRHQKAEIWDPHPHYDIAAFGKTLQLQLEDDDEFLGHDLHITHVSKNYTQLVEHDPRISGCFYTGKVKGDTNSNVAVSLCNGMTGYIRTSDGSYYIEPAEKASDYLSTFLHRIKKIPHTSMHNNNNNNNNNNDVVVREGEDEDSQDIGETTNDNHRIIEDNFAVPEIKVPKSHVISKRDVLRFDDLDTDDIEDLNGFINVDNESFLNDEVFRTTRDTNWVSNDDVETTNKYYLKVLIVADKTMVEYHGGDENLQRYILTLMSHVALLYKHASIGNSISLSVVNMWVLKDMDFDSVTSHEMLKKFCQWQEQNTPPHHHDAAILFTRNKICKNRLEQSCDTLGVAEVASSCNPSASCAIVGDKGLSTSYTIAHELGHVLGMPHDEDKKCIKYHKGLKHNYLMSETVQNDTKFWRWSGCSRHFLTEFLESARAKCLSRRPSQNYIIPKLAILPGENFKLNQQCELEWGEGYKICPYKYDPCWYLWCSTSDARKGCVTRFTPWADGTPCGMNRICHHRTCVSADLISLSPVDGGWGPWQEWTECSRTCGGGVKKSVRNCDSPLPENGGEYCVGRSIRYVSCNTEPCENNSDFRAEQCAEFNGQPKLYNLTQDIKWVPKYGFTGEPERLCRLYCRPDNSNSYYLLKDKVIDGTKCGLNSFDICVNGICRPGGCDNKLDSPITIDECGVCGGDNSQCEEITGTFNISTPSGYSRVLRIPKGSSNLDIRQRAHLNRKNDGIYLALVDGETGNYILNGNHQVSTQIKDIVFGSIMISYSGSAAMVERITTQKAQKLTKDLVVEVLTPGKLIPPDITYRYVIGRDNAPRYGWMYPKQWTKCNSICNGKQTIIPICIDLATNLPQPEHYCPESEKHAPQQDCNTHCQLSWLVASYGACSANCGRGVRNIYHSCVKINTAKENYIHSNKLEESREIVDNKHCAILPPPRIVESCYGKCEGTRWEYSEWSECSTTCGGGTQRRSAKCIDDNSEEIEEHHCSNQEKVIEQICNIEKCPIWSQSDVWSPCSVTCGHGFKTKTFYCHKDGRILDSIYCNPSNRQIEKEPCYEKPCETWYADPWSTCSKTCGDGIQQRNVYCRNLENQRVDESLCQNILKPNSSKPCHLNDCVDVSPFYNDIDTSARFKWVTGSWSQCSKSCGGGITSRIVVCRNDLGEEQYDKCDGQRPLSTTECNLHACPKWTMGGWSQCDSNCERHRSVVCQMYTGSLVSDDQCQDRSKPRTTEKCEMCPQVTRYRYNNYPRTNDDKRYKWKVGRWKPCSKTCGKGVRRRDLECEDTLQGVILVDRYCDHLKKPKLVKPCEKYNCQYAWVESYWSQCSRQCDAGTKTRNVTCHKVYAGGFIDPNPVHKDSRLYRNYCDPRDKPETKATCTLSNCGDRFVWKTGPWKQCSHACGKKGRQIRQLWCVSATSGQKVQKHHCPKQLRPPRKRKCNQWKCLYKNCKEIQMHMHTTDNKDYLISVNGKTVQIYCYKMDTTEPEEYISLQDRRFNYAESYNKRLMDPDTCPYNGERREDCDCLDMDGDRPGVTMFWKVRLNITSLQIKGDDFTFSSQQTKGRQVPFGTAGDCYSKRDCPQGRFSIDLTRTNFKINNLVNWKKTGIMPSAKIDVLDDGRRIQGRCGGYCGDCIPDPNVGLLVDIT